MNRPHGMPVADAMELRDGVDGTQVEPVDVIECGDVVPGTHIASDDVCSAQRPIGGAA